MVNDLNSYLPTPTKRKFAATFSVVRPISFWLQLALSGVSFLALFLAIFSRNATVQTTTQTTTNSVMGFGVFLGIIGLLVVSFRLYWVNRYRRLDKILQSPARELHPSKEDVIQVLQIGLIVSLVGLLLAFLASEVAVIAVLSKILALPQTVAVYRPENVIRPLDIFVVLANVNLIGAHLVGVATSFGLLNWLDQ